MEPKKTEKADLTKKSSLFFSIGLVLTMTIIVMAFEYKTYDDTDVKDLGKQTNNLEEILEVPPTEQPPPPPPKIQQPYGQWNSRKRNFCSTMSFLPDMPLFKLCRDQFLLLVLLLVHCRCVSMEHLVR